MGQRHFLPFHCRPPTISTELTLLERNKFKLTGCSLAAASYGVCISLSHSSPYCRELEGNRLERGRKSEGQRDTEERLLDVHDEYY